MLDITIFYGFKYGKLRRLSTLYAENWKAMETESIKPTVPIFQLNLFLDFDKTLI